MQAFPGQLLPQPHGCSRRPTRSCFYGLAWQVNTESGGGFLPVEKHVQKAAQVPSRPAGHEFFAHRGALRPGWAMLPFPPRIRTCSWGSGLGTHSPSASDLLVIACGGQGHCHGPRDPRSTQPSPGLSHPFLRGALVQLPTPAFSGQVPGPSLGSAPWPGAVPPRATVQI